MMCKLFFLFFKKLVEEKRKITDENIKLENKYNLLNFENEKLKEEISKINLYFDSEKNNYNSAGSMSSINNLQKKIIKMKLKIEELEDIIAQQNSIMDPFKFSDLEFIISENNKIISEKNTQIENLTGKIKEILNKPNFIFDEKQACFSMSQAMREKDVLILDLKKAIRNMLENENRFKIDDSSPIYKFLDKKNDGNQS